MRKILIIALLIGLAFEAGCGIGPPPAIRKGDPTPREIRTTRPYTDEDCRFFAFGLDACQKET